MPSSAIPHPTILVTGGAGFIGSHTVVALVEAGHEVLILDNFSNAKPGVLDRLARLTGRAIPCLRGDVRDRALLDRIFTEHAIGAVIHFAGLKAVGESTQVPLHYYQNNVAGSLHLFEVMQAAGCRNLVFSSSATVYGDPHAVPIREDFPLKATNPYGRTKIMIEDICRDLAASEAGWHIALLRYFNPVGAHPSGLLGEDPEGIPNNLMPYLLQVAAGQRDHLRVFGSDYPTPDGTGVRDYIHVMDLAQGHVAALEALPRLEGAVPINLGTGQGYSVLDMVKALSEVVGRPLPYRLTDRRPGDIACCYAEVARAEAMLGWRAERGLAIMCRDGWAWQASQLAAG
jgi:UDP-glucose 4-epimerase